MTWIQNEEGIYVFEDYKGREHKFKYARIAELFEKIDKLEEGIRDKYFDGDIEFTTGLALVKKMKGQLRRMSNDLDKLIAIRRDGIPEDDDGDE